MPVGNCQREGCALRATHGPVLQIPAKGHSAEPKNCIQMFLGVAACEDHAREPITLPDESKSRIRTAMILAGKAAPDFDRMWIDARPLTDPMFETYRALVARSEGGGRA